MENPSDSRKIKTLLRLFPYLPDKMMASKLQIDNESIHYISIREYAEKISSIIKLHLEMLNIVKEEAIISDATAGVGGDTISFAKNFKLVYGIEIDKVRCEYLKNNIEVYNLNNVKVINGDCTLLLSLIEDHNVVFVDPPWGGSVYKQHNNLRLNLGDLTIESLCNKLMDTSIMKKIPELIILKLPKNYDIVYFYKNVKNKSIYYYDLNKMIILVIMVNNN